MRILLFVTLVMLPFFGHTQTEETESAALPEVGSTTVKKIPMTLVWNSIAGAANYSVMISRTPHFHQSRAFKTTKKRFPIEVEPHGTYYWLVVALDDADNEISDKPVVTFKPSHKSKSRTQLTLKNHNMEKTHAEESETDSQLEISHSSSKVDHSSTGFSASVAIEAGSITLKQLHPSLVDIKSTGFMFPSFSLNLETPKVFEHFFAKFFLQQNIASFKSDTSGISFQDGDFRWLSYGLDINGSWNSGKWTWLPRIGAQQMTTPFFVSNGTALSILDVDYVLGGVGIAATYTPEDTRWQYTLDLSYQTQLSAKSSDFSTTDATAGSQWSAEATATLVLSPVLKTHFYLKSQWMDFEETVVYNNVTSTGTRKSTYLGAGTRLSVSF